MRILLSVLALASAVSAAPNKEELPRGAIARLGTASAAPKSETSLGEIHCLNFLSEKSLFVGTNGGWTAYDLDKRQPRLAKPLGGMAFAVTRDADRLFVGSVKKVHSIGPVESARLEPARSWESTSESVAVLALAPGGKRLAFANGAEQLTLVDVKSGTIAGGVKLIHPAVAASLVANGRVLTVVTRDGAARSFTIAADGKAEPLWIRRVARSSRIPGAFSPDGRTFAVASAGRVLLLEAVTGRTIHSLERRFGEGDVRTLAFSADGRLIAAGTNGPDPVVRVWDAPTGTELASFTGHIGDVNAVAFSADRKTLASGGADTSILLWQVPEGVPQPPAMPIAEVWNALDSLDAPVAHRAMGALLADPVRAIEIVRNGVAAASIEQKKVLRYISELDHDEFRVRETARTAIMKGGLRSAPALTDPTRKALGVEGEERVRQILEAFDSQGVRIPESGFFGEPLRAVRGIRMLEQLGGPDARAAVETIAKTSSDGRTVKEAKSALETWR